MCTMTLYLSVTQVECGDRWQTCLANNVLYIYSAIESLMLIGRVLIYLFFFFHFFDLVQTLYTLVKNMSAVVFPLNRRAYVC